MKGGFKAVGVILGLVLLAAALATAATAAQTQKIPAKWTPKNVKSGKVEVDGSSTVAPFTTACAAVAEAAEALADAVHARRPGG